MPLADSLVLNAITGHKINCLSCSGCSSDKSYHSWDEATWKKRTQSNQIKRKLPADKSSEQKKQKNENHEKSSSATPTVRGKKVVTSVEVHREDSTKNTVSDGDIDPF